MKPLISYNSKENNQVKNFKFFVKTKEKVLVCYEK